MTFGNAWSLLSPSPRKTAMFSSPDESPVRLARLLPAFFSPCGRAFRGVGFLLPMIFHPDTHAYDAYVNGRRLEFGNVFSKPCLPNSKPPTRSIGIALWWIALRCVLPV